MDLVDFFGGLGGFGGTLADTGGLVNGGGGSDGTCGGRK